MGQRNLEQAQAQKAEFDAYVRETAGGPAAEIEHANELLENGRSRRPSSTRSSRRRSPRAS